MNKLGTYNKVIITIMLTLLVFTGVLYCMVGYYLKFISLLVCMLLILNPCIIKKLFNIEIEAIIESIYLVFVILSIYLGLSLELFNRCNIFDNIAHVIFGILGSFLALYILNLFKKYQFKNLIFNITYAICFVISLVVLWEMFEYIMNILFIVNVQRGLGSTMQDIAMTFAGSLIFSLFYIIEINYKKQFIVSKVLNHLKEH